MTHIVRRGETLGSIAARYGTTVMSVMRANGIQNPNLLYEGQALRIPVTNSLAGGTQPMYPAATHLPMTPAASAHGSGGSMPGTPYGMMPNAAAPEYSAPHAAPGPTSMDPLNQYTPTMQPEWSHGGLGPHTHHPHTQRLNRHEQRLDDLETRISNLEAKFGQLGRTH